MSTTRATITTTHNTLRYTATLTQPGTPVEGQPPTLTGSIMAALIKHDRTCTGMIGQNYTEPELHRGGDRDADARGQQGRANELGRYRRSMSEFSDQVDAALDAGGDEEHVQRVTIIDDDPERAQRIAEALALDSDEAPPTTN